MKKIYKSSLTKRKKDREQQRLWYLKNPGKRQEYAQNFNLKNPGKHREHQDNWVIKHPNKYLKIKKKTLAKRYGLTLEQLEEMYKKQKGKCLGCKKPFPTNRAPAIDHNKKCCPGKKSCGKCVRGLLCNSCNTGLGHAREDIKILKNWIFYLGGKV